LNKIDSLPDPDSLQDVVQRLSRHNPVCLISAVTGTGINAMLQRVWQQLGLIPHTVETAAHLG
jgi:50S ribosomal subunit-associated GTPase HflX